MASNLVTLSNNAPLVSFEFDVGCFFESSWQWIVTPTLLFLYCHE